MNKKSELDLGQVGNKLVGGFKQLSTAKLMQINGGQSTNYICNNKGPCDSKNTYNCNNERGGCSLAINEKTCGTF